MLVAAWGGDWQLCSRRRQSERFTLEAMLKAAAGATSAHSTTSIASKTSAFRMANATAGCGDWPADSSRRHNSGLRSGHGPQYGSRHADTCAAESCPSRISTSCRQQQSHVLAAWQTGSSATGSSLQRGVGGLQAVADMLSVLAVIASWPVLPYHVTSLRQASLMPPAMHGDRHLCSHSMQCFLCMQSGRLH